MDKQDQFDDWVAKWEEAQKKGIFKTEKTHVTTPQNQPIDFFGNYRPENTSVRDVDVKYWNRVYKLSNHSGESPDPLDDENQLMTEDTPIKEKEGVETSKYDGKSVAKITDELGEKPQQVPQSTRGKDARKNNVTPNWAGGPDLSKLHELKEKLYELESDLAVDPMKNKSKIAKQIEKLWKQIDELSDSLNPVHKKDYLS